MTRRLLTIGHSYVVTENRRLAHEMAIQGRGRWAVTAIAPQRFRGDLGPIDARAEQGEALDLRTVPVLLDRRIHLMRYARLRAAMEGQWDVVHAWEEPYIAAGAQIAARVPPSAKLVFATFQNLAKDYPWPLSSYERRAMDRADAWIAFGELVKETLSARPAYVDKPCRVIPPGVDTQLFRPDAVRGADTLRQLGWAAGTPVAGFLGRFEPQKGVELLCAALGRVTGPWHALFVGGGSMEPVLREFEARHSPRVRVVTGVPHGEVPRWLNAMTILCAPSQTTAGWREQFGRMIVEAMACGVPVVGSDSGEIPRVIRDAGTIVGERDGIAWTAAIEQLLYRPELRREYSARGLERAAACFAWPVVARTHLALFEELIA